MLTPFKVEDFDHRLKITTLRVQVIHHTLTLALAAATIPVVIVELFSVEVIDCDFRLFAKWGWIALGFSMFGGVLFLSQAPKWARDRARNWLTDRGYEICIGAFFVGVLLLGYAGWLIVTGH